MNRRITKDMATNAAEKIAELKYAPSIKDAHDELVDYVDGLVMKYYPKPVMGVLNEYPDYFYCSHNPLLCWYDNGGDSHMDYARCKVRISGNRKCVIINKDDWDEYRRLKSVWMRLKTERDNFVNEIMFAVYRDLKYEKQVAAKLPEVMKYIEFPAPFCPPAKCDDTYVGLNELIKNIK